MKPGLILLFLLSLSLLLIHCAAQRGEMHLHGEMKSMKVYPKDYVHPLKEINLETVFEENRGMRVLEENATTVRDFYRGGVQEKEEGERFLKEGKWEEGRFHLERSIQFLKVVLKYLPGDEAYRNIYGDHTIIFIPNLLIADNCLKLIPIYKKMRMDEEMNWARREGRRYLSLSMRNVKMEWGFQIRRGFEVEDSR